ncbi:MAG: hypothetical protein M3162_00700 [Thermoproteota archaeon]|nr:hypothetical protein [Thermoproteota archaeon]
MVSEITKNHFLLGQFECPVKYILILSGKHEDGSKPVIRQGLDNWTISKEVYCSLKDISKILNSGEPVGGVEARMCLVW